MKGDWIYEKTWEYIQSNDYLRKNITSLDPIILTETEAMHIWWLREYEDSNVEWNDYKATNEIWDTVTELHKLPFTKWYVLWLDKFTHTGRIIKLNKPIT